MPKRKIEDSDDDVPVFGPEAEKIAVKKAGINIWKMPKQRIEDSDDDVPVYGPEAEKIAVKKARLEDSDDEVPLFGPNKHVLKTAMTRCLSLDRTAKRKRSANRRRSRRVNSLSLPKIISNKRSPVGHKRI